MVTLITIALAGILVSVGMAGYARVQKWCFYGGLVGVRVLVILLLATSHASFISSFNHETHKMFGLNNAYQQVNAAAARPATPRRRSSAARSARACCWCRS